MLGLLAAAMPRSAAALKFTWPLKPGRGSIRLGDEAEWKEDLTCVNPDGSTFRYSIVVKGRCDIEIDVVRISGPTPQPGGGTGELPWGIGPWNDWGGFGSKEAFEREAETMVGGG
jgi:hypothetical protein